MQIRHFNGYVKNFPWLWGNLGGRAQRLNVDPREWIINKIRYIAVRPFDSLDLKVGSWSKPTASPYLDTRAYVEVKYLIIAHIESEKVGDRMRWVGRPDGSENSIAETIRSLDTWSKEYWVKQNRSLRYDYVLKIVLKGNEVDGTTEENANIFPFPPNWTPPAELLGTSST